MTPKPESLEIVAENGELIGTDSTGRRWTIKWCGNGRYSHWTLTPVGEDRGWYLYFYPEKDQQELKEQIKAAEHEYGIYT